MVSPAQRLVAGLSRRLFTAAGLHTTPAQVSAELHMPIDIDLASLPPYFWPLVGGAGMGAAMFDGLRERQVSIVGMAGFGLDDDTPSVTTVASIRPSSRHIFFPAKTQTSISAFTGNEFDGDTINKHGVVDPELF